MTAGPPQPRPSCAGRGAAFTEALLILAGAAAAALAGFHAPTLVTLALTVGLVMLTLTAAAALLMYVITHTPVPCPLRCLGYACSACAAFAALVFLFL